MFDFNITNNKAVYKLAFDNCDNLSINEIKNYVGKKIINDIDIVIKYWDNDNKFICSPPYFRINNFLISDYSNTYILKKIKPFTIKHKQLYHHSHTIQFPKQFNNKKLKIYKCFYDTTE